MNLNLTSKYRSKFLSEIVGQTLVTQFLLNSLYKNFLYPLYLFSGMHGTGKTSTARLFSISFLCEEYKKKIIKDIPCYKCESCIAYKKNRHPDIIELDAASNNGVETIRTLIENVPILPVFGTYKFYIIDEVHMLSKAAFNACLKIMEEPPKHVCFILATTEIGKVIETIRSRSILLKFNPVKKNILFDHLLEICEKENIKIEKNFLELICDLSEGSVRDSLNILEKFRMLDFEKNKDEILRELNSYENKIYLNFIDSVLSGKENLYFEFKELFILNFINKKIFWKNVINELQKRVFEKDNQKIIKFLKFFYENEKEFLTSIDSSGILDLCFFEINNKDTINSSNNNENFFLDKKEKENKVDKEFEKVLKKEEFKKLSEEKVKNNSTNFIIDEFIKTITIEEKALGVIFSRAKIIYDDKILKCFFPKKLQFYKNFLEEKEEVWKKILEKIFGFNSLIEINFEEIGKEKINNLEFKTEIKKEEIQEKKSFNFEFLNKNKFNEKKIINSDEKLIIVKEIEKFFPGKLNIIENKNEKKYYT